MAARTSFYDALRATDGAGPVACVGIDPSAALLRRWSLPDDAEGALAFGRVLLEAARGRVRVVKFQVAHFERFGAMGYGTLARLLAEAREAGLLAIADAKRGDIDASSEAYGRAWLGPGAPLRVDALTVSPYLGLGALEPLFDLAAEHGACAFVVARSSNPEGEALQGAGDPPVWTRVLDGLAERAPRYGRGTLGAVVGATAPRDLAFALGTLPDAPILAPGVGRQGATMEDLRGLGAELGRVVVSSSRGIAERGPEMAAVEEAVASLVEV